MSLLTEAQRLYDQYYDRIRAMSPDFADELLREALKCYSVEAHTTACIACRVAVEEELKEIYELVGSLGDRSAWQFVESMQLESLKLWAMAVGIITGTQMSTIEHIQGRGNRSAHGPTSDMQRQMRNRTLQDLANPLEIWADRQDAQTQIQSTARILRKLKQKKEQIRQEQRIR